MQHSKSCLVVFEIISIVPRSLSCPLTSSILNTSIAILTTGSNPRGLVLPSNDKFKDYFFCTIVLFTVLLVPDLLIPPKLLCFFWIVYVKELKQGECIANTRFFIMYVSMLILYGFNIVRKINHFLSAFI